VNFLKRFAWLGRAPDAGKTLFSPRLIVVLTLSMVYRVLRLV
jgi:hypothetical protein